MKLDEIFITNPELRDNPEVKKLIEYCESAYKGQTDLLVKYLDFHDSVLEKVMTSELVLKNGRSHKDTLIKILELLEKT